MKWNDDGRQCTRCDDFLPWSSFSSKGSKRYKDGGKTHQRLQPQCKTCATELTKQWRESNSLERLKDLYLQNKYNITYEDWLRMIDSQNRSCKICERSLDCSLGNEKIKPNSAVVDHCHSTGRVRGILCNECNRGLGYFKDNAIALAAASNYLLEN